MIVKLTEQEGNLSGKKISLSGFGLFDTKFKAFDGAAKEIQRYNETVLKGTQSTKEFLKTVSDPGLRQYFTSIKNGKATMDDYGASIGKVNRAAKAAAFGMKALSVAMNIGVMLLVSAAITGITKGIQALVTANERAIEKANELIDTYKSGVDEISGRIDLLRNLGTELGELSEGVNEQGENIGLSTDQYTRYKAIVQQIVDISPKVVKGYNDENEAIIDNNTALKDAIDFQEKLLDLKNKEYLSSGKDILKGAKAEMADAQKEMGKIAQAAMDALFERDFGNKKQGQLMQALGDTKVFGADLTSDNLLKYQEQIVNTAKELGVFSDQEIRNFQEQIDLLEVKNHRYEESRQKVADYLNVYAQDENQSKWYDQIKVDFLDDFDEGIALIAADTTLSFDEMKDATDDLMKGFIAIQDSVPLDEVKELNNPSNRLQPTILPWRKALLRLSLFSKNLS